MRILIFLIVLATLSVGIYAGDLYLLGINSGHELETVRDNVAHAHGRIDGKFIVHLDADQIENLKSAGIRLELIAADVTLENIYMVSKIHPEISAPLVPIRSLYTAEFKQLAQLSREEIEQLGKDGYMVIPIDRKETPFFYHAPLIAGPRADSYPADTIADLVNQDSLYYYVTHLEDFQSRYVLTDSIISAGLWLENKLENFGYADAYRQLFIVNTVVFGVEYVNLSCYNVIGVKIGTEFPDKFIVVGAHYDSYNHNGPSDNMIWAPGADDNASGTAGVLELARIFKDIETRKSLMFVPFSAEEIGLLGAEHCADELYEDATDIELMINFDMIGFQEDDINNFDLAYSCPMPYCNVFSEASVRVSDLIPVSFSYAYCDAEPFDDCGYNNISPIEGEPATGVHTDYDVSDSMDFAYMEKIVRTTAVSIGIIDQSLDPVSCRVRDFGDGQSLRVEWDDCSAELNYKVIYGTSINHLNDTVDVPYPDCTQDITGLTEGVQYIIAVIPYTPDGYYSIVLDTSSMAPLSVPRMPTGVHAIPDSAAIILKWSANTELDISHYKIFRKPVGFPWEVLFEYYADTVYNDTEVEAHQQYYYRICAVDYDANVSDTSAFTIAAPVTLDLGILAIDETQGGSGNPTESEQLAFYYSMLDTFNFELTKVDSADDAISRSIMGQYNPVFWIDDDDYNHILENSLDSLQWYFGFNTDFLLAGWSTIYAITGQKYFYPGNFYYDELGISYIAQNPLTDFTGATGVGGWPDLELKPEAPGGARMPDIDIFTAAPAAEVIYTFDSYSSHPYYGNKPVGIAYDTHHGKRVLFGFPLYWLTEASAQALIARVMEYFAEESVLYGDVNGDWALNILDITYLIAYLYQDGPPPIDMNNGDPNSDCGINILDITYLINHLYKGGPAPVEGCVIE